MGASVGIGALIVGVSMLVVFALAVDAFEQEVQSAIAEVEDSAETLPKVKIENATLVSGAILNIKIDTAGTGCTDASNQALGVAGGTGHGLTGNWTSSGGGVTSVTITTRGTYSVLPTVTAAGIAGCTVAPVLSISSSAKTGWGNVINLNLTNEGSETLETEGFWLSADGGEPVSLTNNYTRSWIYPGETIYVEWIEAGTTAFSRLAVNAAGTTVATAL